MRWVVIRQGRWASDDGRYEIDSATYVNESGPLRRYEGRRTRLHPDGPHCVCVEIASLAACKGHCEADSRGE